MNGLEIANVPKCLDVHCGCYFTTKTTTEETRDYSGKEVSKVTITGQWSLWKERQEAISDRYN